MGLIVRGDLKTEDGKVVVKAGTTVDKKVVDQIDKLGLKWIDVKPHVTEEIRYLRPTKRTATSSPRPTCT